MRELSEGFINDLKNPDGLLYPILKRVQQNHTLMLAIRDGYINIYYRGGNILKISKKNSSSYKAEFNVKYNKLNNTLPELPASISDQSDATKWVVAFPVLKEVMDLFFAKHNKPEREFQQLVARENNYSTISNHTEYFISDIEFTGKSLIGRYDMLAIRWLATQRSGARNCKAAFIEMKYAEGSLGGATGLIKHLSDIRNLIADKGDRYKRVIQIMESQFNQLYDLGLLNFNLPSNVAKIKLDPRDKPEIIILLSNFNPRSKKLDPIFKELDLMENDIAKDFELKFFNARFAGYGLHSDCMLNLEQFRGVVESKKS